MGLQARILGTGSYLPQQVVDNAEIGRTVGLSPEAIYRRTGIRERRWAGPDEAASTLGAIASRLACEAAGVAPASLDCIILSTTSPDTPIPSTACHVQHHLGAGSAAAFDIAASCSGFLYGLSMADRFIRAARFKRCLVVAAEVKSRFLDLTDGGTAILFGDGAGAAVVGAEVGTDPPERGILAVRLSADGSRSQLIQVPAGGSRLPATMESIQAGRHTIKMQGGALFRVAVRRLEESVRDLLKEFGLKIEQVDQAVFHQANGRLLAALAKRLGLPPQKVCTVLEQYGNTSSASLPIALDVASREHRFTPGQLTVLGAFGGGLTWGSALIRW